MIENSNDKILITTLIRKPAKQGDDYHFSIPRDDINLGIIDPNQHYELEIYILPYLKNKKPNNKVTL